MPRDYQFFAPTALERCKGGRSIDVPGGSLVPQLAAELFALPRFSKVVPIPEQAAAGHLAGPVRG